MLTFRVSEIRRKKKHNVFYNIERKIYSKPGRNTDVECKKNSIYVCNWILSDELVLLIANYLFSLQYNDFCEKKA